VAKKPTKTPTRKPTKETAVATVTSDAPPPAKAKSKKDDGPPGGVLEWRQTSKDTWLADDPAGDKTKAGGRIKMSGQKWLYGPDADPIYFVYRDGNYLGQDTSLEAAQRRAQYRESSSTVLKDQVEGGGMPAFLNLSEKERRAQRANAPPPAPARPFGAPAKARTVEAGPPPDDPALAKALAERQALAGARASTKDQKKAERKAAKMAVRFDDDAVITVTVEKNPRKPGTGAHARFALLMEHSGKTVAAFKAAKGNMETLENAVKDGRASVKGKDDE
jgi:hypothetical protein